MFLIDARRLNLVAKNGTLAAFGRGVELYQCQIVLDPIVFGMEDDFLHPETLVVFEIFGRVLLRPQVVLVKPVSYVNPEPEFTTTFIREPSSDFDVFI